MHILIWRVQQAAKGLSVARDVMFGRTIASAADSPPSEVFRYYLLCEGTLPIEVQVTETHTNKHTNSL